MAVPASAFAPSSSVVYRRSNSVAAAAPPSRAASHVLFMSDAEAQAEKLRAQAAKLREEVAEATGTTVEELEAEVETKSVVVKNSDGTVYDDEAPEYRDTLSDSMKERLRREASAGLDSESKQTNVILYISLVVAVLVVLGGQGILY